MQIMKLLKISAILKLCLGTNGSTPDILKEIMFGRSFLETDQFNKFTENGINNCTTRS